MLLVAIVALSMGCRGNDQDGQSGDTVTTIAPLYQAVPVGALVEHALQAAGADADTPEVVRSCAAARMDADTDLTGALGDDPAASPRLPEVRKLVDECRATAGQGDALVSALGDRAHGSLSLVQLACVRDVVMRYDAAERQQVIDAKVVDLAPGPLRDRVTELLSICSIDGSNLGTPGTAPG
jgi:hypothetical protein